MALPSDSSIPVSTGSHKQQQDGIDDVGMSSMSVPSTSLVSDKYSGPVHSSDRGQSTTTDDDDEPDYNSIDHQQHRHQIDEYNLLKERKNLEQQHNNLRDLHSPASGHPSNSVLGKNTRKRGSRYVDDDHDYPIQQHRSMSPFKDDANGPLRSSSSSDEGLSSPLTQDGRSHKNSSSIPFPPMAKDSPVSIPPPITSASSSSSSSSPHCNFPSSAVVIEDDDPGLDHALPPDECSDSHSQSNVWRPQNQQSTCEFTHTIMHYSQKRESGCKKAEYSSTTVDAFGNKWRLIVYVNGNGRASNHHLSLFLQVADADELPFGWKKAVSYVLTLEHPSGPNLGYAKRNPDKTFKLCPKAIDWGWSQFITSDRIQQEGYVDNDSLTVRASVTVKSSSVFIDADDAELYLKCAVEEGDAEAVNICLAQGASVNCQFKDDLYTPLHTACSSSSSTGTLEVLKLLLDKGADGNACNKWRETPLLIAANNGHRAAVEALLDHGADPSLCSEAGWSALTFAAHKGYDDIVSLLLASGAPVNCKVTEDLSTPLHKACAGGKPGHLSAVQQLLRGKADVHALNKWRETPLLTAANHGQATAVEVLLRSGADPCKCTDTGWSPLSIAAYKGHDDVVRLLLEEGAPTEEADPTLSALLQAATKGLPDTVELLLRHGADHTVTTKKGDTALSILVEQNLIDAAVEMVTEYKASVPRCSRDRKKVQRARLLINLRVKQQQKEGLLNGDMDSDTDDDDDDSEQDEFDNASNSALHSWNGSPVLPAPESSKKKKKKKNNKAKNIESAEAQARAAEEALLLELEREDEQAQKEEAAATSKRAKKKKKRERERQLRLEEERLREEKERKEQDEKEAREREIKLQKEKAEKERREKQMQELERQREILRKKEAQEAEKQKRLQEQRQKEKKELMKKREKEERERKQQQLLKEREKKEKEKKNRPELKSTESSPSGNTATSRNTPVPRKKEIAKSRITKKKPSSQAQNASSTDLNVSAETYVPKTQAVKANSSGTNIIKSPHVKKRGWEVKTTQPASSPHSHAESQSRLPTQHTPISPQNHITNTPARAPSSAMSSYQASSNVSPSSMIVTHRDTLSHVPYHPQVTVPGFSVEDELENMANGVVDFLGFDSSPQQPDPMNHIRQPNNAIRHHSNGLNRTITNSQSLSFGHNSVVELPPVVLFQYEKVEELFHRSSQLGIIDDVTLRSVIYRYMVRASHSQSKFLDPIIPSWVDNSLLTSFLQRQLISEQRRVSGNGRGMLSVEMLKEAGSTLADICISIAKDLSNFRIKWLEQVPHDWNDNMVGIRAQHVVRNGDNVGFVVLDWSGHQVSIAHDRFEMLRKRYCGPQHKFLTAIFAVVKRFETRCLVSGSNMDYSLSSATMGALYREAGVTIELWSDPLSTSEHNIFLSAFHDVESCFGGLHPFGKEGGGGELSFMEGGGSAVVVPPLESSTSENYLRNIVNILEHTEDSNIPLSFVVFLPSECFRESTSHPSANDLCLLDPRLGDRFSRFVRHVQTLRGGNHIYVSRKGEEVTPKDGSLFVLLQNSSGKVHFPISDISISNILSSMCLDYPNKVPAVVSQPMFENKLSGSMGNHDPHVIGGSEIFVGSYNSELPRSRRGRFFELEENGDDDAQAVDVMTDMYANLNMSMFHNHNNSQEVDIENLALLGIGGGSAPHNEHNGLQQGRFG